MLGAAAWALQSGAGVVPDPPRARSTTGTGRAVAALRVGDRSFSPSDIEASRRVLALRYPDSPSVDLGAWSRLIESTLQQVALARMGKALTNEDIAVEERRIDGSTRLPEDLARIKNACGSGETYREVYVRPTLAARRFHFEVYPWYPAAHAQRRKVAEAILERATRGRLANAAAGTGARVEAGLLSRGGFTATREPARDPWRLRDAEALLGEVRQLQPNGSLARVLEEQTEFVVLERGPGTSTATGPLRVEIAIVPKSQADEWLWRETKDVAIEVADDRIAERLRKEVAWTQHTALSATR